VTLKLPAAPKPSAKAGLLAAMVIAAGLSQIARPGYSVDEEFTVFAVRGIHAHGVPLLPSGLLYDRGLAYSYLSAGAGGAQGAVLEGARALSLLAAAIAVWVTFRFVADLSGESAGFLAALLVTTSVPYWATATSARFYAPFFLVCLAVLRTLSTLSTSSTPSSLRTLGTLCTLAMFARWLHELAFLLAVLPVVCAIVDRERRSSWILASASVIAGLIAAQAAIFALHALQPAAGETMVRRFFLWQVLNLFQRPGDRQFMIPIVVMAIAWVAAPKKHASAISVVALSIAAMIVAFSIARATNGAPFSAALLRSVLVDGSRYPLHMFWHIARTTPVTLALALAGLVTRLATEAVTWPRSERVLHLLWMGWVLWFGVIDSGITTNYLLLPMSLMLMAIAVDYYAILMKPDAPLRRHFSNPSRPAWASLVLLMVFVARDQWRGPGSMLATLEAARPTIQVDRFAEIRDGLQPTDRVVCTDELGCLMTVGRIDRWLALDDYVRERFVVRSGNGPMTGVYTGVPAAFRPADLFAPNADGSFPDRVLIVDIFKEYPIGNSRSWLPRAIDEDGVRIDTLLETSQARVIEVRPPEHAARLSLRWR
jgi:hypothetical protein